MTRKKIEFSKKPLAAKDANRFIDNWVSGKVESEATEKRLKRTTVYLPDELHKKLKIKAANSETSMTDIIVQILESNIKAF